MGWKPIVSDVPLFAILLACSIDKHQGTNMSAVKVLQTIGYCPDCIIIGSLNKAEDRGYIRFRWTMMRGELTHVGSKELEYMMKDARSCSQNGHEMRNIIRAFNDRGIKVLP